MFLCLCPGNNHQCDDAESDETVNGQIKDECMDVAEAKAEEGVLCFYAFDIIMEEYW